MRTATIAAFVCLLGVEISMALSGCDGPSSPKPVGSGVAGIEVRSAALSAANIERVEVTVTGPGISPPIVVEVPEVPEDFWYVLIEDIPAGVDRTFTALAYDKTDTLIYSGEAAGITIEDDVAISITIQLEEVNPPLPFDNAVPVIHSLVASPMNVKLGEEVTLMVVATDADPEDILTYAWTATDGSFSDNTAAETIWTAPDEAGTYAVTITVSDPHGAVTELSVNIAVSVPNGIAGVHIVVGNSSPAVTDIIPSPGRIDVGESTELDLTVEDPEEVISDFEWSADCIGTFDDIHIEDPIFTLTELTGDTCTLTVQVKDSNGAANHGSITIETGPAIEPVDIPAGCYGAINFPDPAWEAYVRKVIEIPTGDIYYDDLDHFYVGNADNLGISDITGIQCIENLSKFYLDNNNISDISELSGLTSLRWLKMIIRLYI